MINKIRSILDSYKDIRFLLRETGVEASEFFFVKKALDMKRLKSVTKFQVTIYRDFEEKGKRFRGSSTVTIHPTMTEKEIRDIIDSASFAAGFVRNPFYPLVKKLTGKINQISTEHPDSHLPELFSLIHNASDCKKGGINSVEMFTRKCRVRIMNSEGIDVSYTLDAAQLEFIVQWKETEDVELYRDIHFSPERMSQAGREIEIMLEQVRERAVARPTPSGLKCPVILSGQPAAKLFEFYQFQASAAAVYQKVSTAEIGKDMQGITIGDRVSLRLQPFLVNSVYSAPYDYDGFPLEVVEVIRDGTLLKIWGPQRYCHYLGIEPTGAISNIEVSGGRYDLKTLRSEPYLEARIFSHFDLDESTGDFGGELRLGWYFDGHDRYPVTGGSITGNLKECQKEIYLSSEIQSEGCFQGPEAVKCSASISG